MRKIEIGLIIFLLLVVAVIAWGYMQSEPAADIEISQSSSQIDEAIDILELENQKQEMILAFQMYAKNQDIELSYLRAEYYASIVLYQSNITGVNPALLKAIIVVESGADEQAVSYKGAKGLMQIMPATWKGYKCKGRWSNPEDNIQCGVNIISDLIQRYGDMDVVVRYYLCGETAKDCLDTMRTDAYLSAIKRDMENV